MKQISFPLQPIPLRRRAMKSGLANLVRTGLAFAVIATLTLAHAADQGTRNGPATGPRAQPHKRVVFIAADYRNGGVMGMYRGFEQATATLGWKVTTVDGGGSKEKWAALLANAIASHPHGIVFGGFEPDDFSEQVAAAKRARIVMVGWHAAKDPGPTKDLFVNVATDPVDVARIAAAFVIKDAMANKKPVGVIIFNDNQYAVANAKTEAMKKTVEACQGYAGCKVLAVENVLISDAANAIPALVPKLNATHGAAWTYSLAINDVYFDFINYPLITAKRNDILNVSAGDGSNKAIGRIRAGISQQAATVAEPLKMQGYQLADELNRAFAGEGPSGYVSKPILVTTKLLKATGGVDVEAGLGFEAAYSALWHRK